jgi:hypothetical protein
MPQFAQGNDIDVVHRISGCFVTVGALEKAGRSESRCEAASILDESLYGRVVSGRFLFESATGI